ncbi:hypothetical protein AAMO2058_000503100 [Amorphochlora amoebiformis]
MRIWFGAKAFPTGCVIVIYVLFALSLPPNQSLSSQGDNIRKTLKENRALHTQVVDAMSSLMTRGYQMSGELCERCGCPLLQNQRDATKSIDFCVYCDQMERGKIMENMRSENNSELNPTPKRWGGRLKQRESVNKGDEEERLRQQIWPEEQTIGAQQTTDSEDIRERKRLAEKYKGDDFYRKLQERYRVPVNKSLLSTIYPKMAQPYESLHLERVRTPNLPERPSEPFRDKPPPSLNLSSDSDILLPSDKNRRKSQRPPVGWVNPPVPGAVRYAMDKAAENTEKEKAYENRYSIPGRQNASPADVSRNKKSGKNRGAKQHRLIPRAEARPPSKSSKRSKKKDIFSRLKDLYKNTTKEYKSISTVDSDDTEFKKYFSTKEALSKSESTMEKAIHETSKMFMDEEQPGITCKERTRTGEKYSMKIPPQEKDRGGELYEDIEHYRETQYYQAMKAGYDPNDPNVEKKFLRNQKLKNETVEEKRHHRRLEKMLGVKYWMLNSSDSMPEQTKTKRSVQLAIQEFRRLKLLGWQDIEGICERCDSRGLIQKHDHVNSYLYRKCIYCDKVIRASTKNLKPPQSEISRRTPEVSPKSQKPSKPPEESPRSPEFPEFSRKSPNSPEVSRKSKEVPGISPPMKPPTESSSDSDKKGSAIFRKGGKDYISLKELFEMERATESTYTAKRIKPKEERGRQEAKRASDDFNFTIPAHWPKPEIVRAEGFPPEDHMEFDVMNRMGHDTTLKGEDMGIEMPEAQPVEPGAQRAIQRAAEMLGEKAEAYEKNKKRKGQNGDENKDATLATIEDLAKRRTQQARQDPLWIETKRELKSRNGKYTVEDIANAKYPPMHIHTNDIKFPDNLRNITLMEWEEREFKERAEKYQRLIEQGGDVSEFVDKERNSTERINIRREVNRELDMDPNDLLREAGIVDDGVEFEGKTSETEARISIPANFLRRNSPVPTSTPTSQPTLPPHANSVYEPRDPRRSAGDSWRSSRHSRRSSRDSGKSTRDSRRSDGDSRRLAEDSSRPVGDSRRLAGDSRRSTGESRRSVGASRRSSRDSRRASEKGQGAVGKLAMKLAGLAVDHSLAEAERRTTAMAIVSKFLAKSTKKKSHTTTRRRKDPDFPPTPRAASRHPNLNPKRPENPGIPNQKMGNPEIPTQKQESPGPEIPPQRRENPKIPARGPENPGIPPRKSEDPRNSGYGDRGRFWDNHGDLRRGKHISTLGVPPGRSQIPSTKLPTQQPTQMLWHEIDPAAVRGNDYRPSGDYIPKPLRPARDISISSLSSTSEDIANERDKLKKFREKIRRQRDKILFKDTDDKEYASPTAKIVYDALGGQMREKDRYLQSQRGSHIEIQDRKSAKDIAENFDKIAPKLDLGDSMDDCEEDNRFAERNQHLVLDNAREPDISTDEDRHREQMDSYKMQKLPPNEHILQRLHHQLSKRVTQLSRELAEKGRDPNDALRITKIMSDAAKSMKKVESKLAKIQARRKPI